MSIKASLMASGAVLALLATSTPSFAQDAAPAQAAASSASSDEVVVVVTGLRKSLQNATTVKRNASQIVDSIVAEDIGKMPDTNIAETLQRIPGVQISRNTRGEGNAYVLHGLSQVMTTVNGRTLFTTSNRSANLLDFSADILSGVDVYKTATADQIEGGLGGLINIHAARPFDYKGLHMTGTVSANYSDIHSAVTPRVSALVSNTWETGVGKIGWLVGFQHEDIDSGGYKASTNGYTSQTLSSGDVIYSPSSVTMQYELGERTREAYYTSVQWRPHDGLTFFADALYTYSGGHSFTQDLVVKTNASGHDITYAGDSGIPSTATYDNATVQSATSASDNPYRNYDFAIGGDWSVGHLTTHGEIDFERSVGPFFYRTLTLNTTAPSATIDLSGRAPDVSISGVDLNSAANYTYGSYYDLANNAYGKETAARLDFTYTLDKGPFTDIKAGARYSDHRTIYDVYGITYTTANSGLTTDLSGVSETTHDDLFRGITLTTNQWLAIQRDIMLDYGASRALAGLSPNHADWPLSGHYDYREKVSAAYIEGDFSFTLGKLPLDGNIGLRNVHTEGNQRVYVNNAPVTGGGAYDNLLPSLNLRAKLTDDLFLRLATSKSIARPDYGNLSPALVLNTTSMTGSGGNKDLQPVKSDNYDASLEYYFGRSNYAAFSLFRKNVDGFVQTFSANETVDGQTYLISRPRNSGTGTLQGGEIGYQQFFDFLPSLWSGLGVQANYTYIDSALTLANSTRTAPAQNVSKNSYNITGIYEKGPLSLHLSYNWRDKYVVSTSADAAGHMSWEAPLKSLDFSATYNITRHLSFKLDAVNLLFDKQVVYYGTPNQPYYVDQLDRSIEAGLHFTY
ncbi:MAG: TonB-dependent receptor [Asticcacaulis sp.]|uniref:TonB-dependent receptor n=1 Tax=Asticcacaulis sp. TaxID=1872648 RepID=UPI0039E5C0D8